MLRVVVCRCCVISAQFTQCRVGERWAYEEILPLQRSTMAADRACGLR